MRTEKVKVYKFQELKPKIQEKVFEDNRDINTQFEWWDFLHESFKEDLEQYGIECEGFNWDIYSGGYIAMYKPQVNTDKFLKKVLEDTYKKSTLQARQMLATLEDDSDEDDFELYIDTDTYGNYGNKNYVKTEGEMSENLKELLEGIDLTEYLNNILEGFLKQLQTEYEYLMSDEAIQDTLIANEIEFLENGKRW